MFHSLPVREDPLKLQFHSQKLVFIEAESIQKELHDTWTEGLLEEVEEDIEDQNMVFYHKLQDGALKNFRKYDDYEFFLNGAY